jgi:pimeloyl-ACP methyl ester carboxylesterase/GNAT superfamily N-acetyltransferase
MSFKAAVKTVRVGNLYFHTEHFGDFANPACLLISGAMAPARFWTDAFCTHLADCGFFVIRYDHRDMGESCAVDWQKAPYTLADLASDAISILDAYGIKQAHFVGHSMGGYIAQVIALEFPKRTLSICLISAGPIGATLETDRPLTDQEQALQKRTWEVMLSRKDGPSKESLIQSFLPVWKYLNGHFPIDESMAIDYTKDLILRSHHPIREGNNHELVMRFLDLKKARNVLQKMDVPTLVIHGDADPLALPRNGKSVAYAISRAHLIMIPGMGHMFFHKELEEKIAALVMTHLKNALRNMLERNMHLHMTYFSGKMPNVALLPIPDVTAISSEIADDMFNYVLSAHFTKENADQQIRHVIAEYQKRHLPFSWWVSESDTPSDLEDRLVKHGLTFKEKDIGMVLDLDKFLPESAQVLHFEPVHSQKTIKDFADIIRSVGGHPECYDRFYKQIPFAVLEEGSPLEMHVAYLRENPLPVVTGVIVFGGSIAGIYYLATLPDQRRKGYGTAMMKYLFNRAKQKGYLLAGLEASHEGESLYKRLGFHEVCVFREYAYIKGTGRGKG